MDETAIALISIAALSTCCGLILASGFQCGHWLANTIDGIFGNQNMEELALETMQYNDVV